MNYAERLLFLAALVFATGNAHSQLDNGGFEVTTVTDVDTVPTGWSFSDQFGTGITTDAHTGDHAVGVWTWYWYGTASIVNGQDVWSQHNGTPISGTPTGLAGYYKRQVGNTDPGQTTNDSALVTMILTRWNPGTLQRDTVAFGSAALGEQADWEPFGVQLEYLTAAPADTVVVRADSDIDCFCGMESNGTCCYLWLDDLSLDFGSGITFPLMDDDRVRVLAMGDGSLEVRTTDPRLLPLRIELFDAMGRDVASVQLRETVQRIRSTGRPGLLNYRIMADNVVLARGKSIAY